jgi:pimeloyl-ACP methyl ester carboxylesterase
MPHILLLHGALGSKEQFDPLIAKLESDFTIDTISFSGHGRTPSLDHAFTIQNCAHEVLHWLNEKQRRQIDIFGYSMGGYLALWLARFYPDRVGKIFTLGTKLEWNEGIAEKEIKLLNAEKITAKVPAFAKELQERHSAQHWHSVLHKTANLMHDLGKNHLTDEDFRQINSPVLLGLGDKDTMVSKEETFHVEKQIPNARFVKLKDTPHPLDKVNIDPLATEIRAFFK